MLALQRFRLDKESMRPLWSLPLQQFVYRQLVYVILLRSMLSAFAGVALQWQKLHRTGAAAAHHARSVTEPDPLLAELAAVAPAVAEGEQHDGDGQEQNDAVAVLAR
jgi:hypothetical protein